MYKELELILWKLSPCFSRRAAFHWFLIIVFGLIIRLDHLGVSSFVRWLFLTPECYEPMLRFFRAGSWSLEDLLTRWCLMCMDLFPAIEFNGRRLLIGDTIKVVKEAKKMPGVKTLRQDSENSRKPEFIQGHHFGFVGLLVGSINKALCVPLKGELHEGIDGIRAGEPFKGKPATLITRMARLVVEKARKSGCLCYVALDAYFSVGPTFEILKEAVNHEGKRLVHVITRAKDNYVAYLYLDAPQKRIHERKKVSLQEILDFPELLTEVELSLYGQTRQIRYYCEDFLWKPINDLVRFVCVLDGTDRYVLMCSDLELCAEEIITIYSLRAKIEVMFMAIKHLIGSFCYRFWTKSFPKLKRKEVLNCSTLTRAQSARLNLTIEAIERFVNLAALALGLLQYLALTRSSQIWQGYQGWLRTYPPDIPSEAVVQSVLQAEFFSGSRVPFCRTLELIRQRGREPSLKLAA